MNKSHYIEGLVHFRTWREWPNPNPTVTLTLNLTPTLTLTQ